MKYSSKYLQICGGHDSVSTVPRIDDALRHLCRVMSVMSRHELRRICGAEADVIPTYISRVALVPRIRMLIKAA